MSGPDGGGQTASGQLCMRLGGEKRALRSLGWKSAPSRVDAEAQERRKAKGLAPGAV